MIGEPGILKLEVQTAARGEICIFFELPVEFRRLRAADGLARQQGRTALQHHCWCRNATKRFGNQTDTRHADPGWPILQSRIPIGTIPLLRQPIWWFGSPPESTKSLRKMLLILHEWLNRSGTGIRFLWDHRNGLSCAAVRGYLVRPFLSLACCETHPRSFFHESTSFTGILGT